MPTFHINNIKTAKLWDSVEAVAFAQTYPSEQVDIHASGAICISVQKHKLPGDTNETKEAALEDVIGLVERIIMDSTGFKLEMIQMELNDANKYEVLFQPRDKKELAQPDATREKLYAACGALNHKLTNVQSAILN